ncbi:MAG: hypothetical protein NTW29_15110 [Bacteroidetes bacterium]|nr:hypothetical protein [Bacteroidota bacterium]
MRSVCFILLTTILVSCSSVSFLNKNKIKNVGSVSVVTSPIGTRIQSGNDTNTILNRPADLGALLLRRISGRQTGTFFAVLIDSLRDSYIETTILSHDKDSISFYVSQSPLSKRDTFKFIISFDMSTLSVRNFTRTSDNSYSLSVKNQQNDTARTFQILKSNNFIIQKDVLEVMTGEIVNPDGNKAQFIAINDLHDVDVSLTGLCFIYVPNMTLLRLECSDMAKILDCPKGKKPVDRVITKKYMLARDYRCIIDCK